MVIPSDILNVVNTLRRHNYQAWIVGGSVRDLVIGRAACDYDIATDAQPQEVMGIFRKTIPTGIKHGTVTVLTGRHSVEVTTFRQDGKYTDSRRPDSVSFSATLHEDLARRDFTINGIAYNPATAEFVDPYGGMMDIKDRIIRTIGDPTERFSEDGLRPMRACRLAAQLGFSIEKKTFEAIGACLDAAGAVSAERIRDELVKIILCPVPSAGFELLRESGLLKLFIPELLTGHGIKQNKYHKYDIYLHNLFSCDAAKPDDYRIRLAALFHDIGKAYAKKEVEEEKDKKKSVFYNHEIIGAALTRKIMRRLKFSNEDINIVTHLIRNHMFHYTSQWTDGAVRRFMRKVGLDNIEALFELRRADRIGNGLKRGESGSITNLRRRINKVIEEENAITVRDLAVDGYDIMGEFQLEPGPIIGKILHELLEQILDDPSKNTRETLLTIAREVYARESGKVLRGSPQRG